MKLLVRRVSLLLLVFSFSFWIFGISHLAHAEEDSTSLMEWLTLESRETPVGTLLVDAPENVSVASAPVLTIPTISQIIFQYPLLVRPRITTVFSSAHPGVDFAVPSGSQVDAAESGVVTEAGWSRLGYGNTIVIHHTSNTYTRYAHLSAIQVSMGQYVLKGSPIGLVGCTGRCTGPHLHFEVRVDNHFIDPLSVIQI